MKKADPTLMTKEEFFQMIDEAKKGPSKRFDSVEELDQYISAYEPLICNITDLKGRFPNVQ